MNRTLRFLTLVLALGVSPAWAGQATTQSGDMQSEEEENSQPGDPVDGPRPLPDAAAVAQNAIPNP